MAPVKHRDEVLLAVGHLTHERGYPPTYREIAEELGLSVSAIHRIVAAMVKAGDLMADPHLARSIRVMSPNVS